MRVLASFRENPVGASVTAQSAVQDASPGAGFARTRGYAGDESFPRRNRGRAFPGRAPIAVEAGRKAVDMA